MTAMTAMTDGRLDPWLLDDDSAAQAAADPAAVADAAMQVLAGIGDAATMAEWRLRALARGAGDEMSRLSDHEIAARIVVAIEGGRVTLAGAPPRLLPLAPPPASAAPPPPAPAPSPRRAAPAAPAAAPATTFSQTLDVAAMVAVLRQAASDGVPFCEECAKAAAQRDAAGVPA